MLITEGAAWNLLRSLVAPLRLGPRLEFMDASLLLTHEVFSTDNLSSFYLRWGSRKQKEHKSISEGVGNLYVKNNPVLTASKKKTKPNFNRKFLKIKENHRK